MKLDKKGEDFIKHEEGFSLEAYKDSGGVWTILWGFTYSPISGKPIKQGDRLTEADAEVWWEKAIKIYEEVINNLFRGITLTQNNFNALVSLCWNIGKGAIISSTLALRIKILAEYKRVSAIPDFLIKDSISYWFIVWHMDNGEINKGLLDRRKREIKLYFS